MCGMTGNLDRYGEPIEEDDQLVDNKPVFTAPGGCPEQLFSSGRPATRDEIHRDRCAELRRILKDARDRREAQP